MTTTLVPLTGRPSRTDGTESGTQKIAVNPDAVAWISPDQSGKGTIVYLRAIRGMRFKEPDPYGDDDKIGFIKPYAIYVTERFETVLARLNGEFKEPQ